MKSPLLLGAALFLTLQAAAFPAPKNSLTTLEAGWQNPPDSAKLRAYWWWLNGNVTKASITNDLEQMRAKGFGGAVIFDADGASQDKNDRVPHGPTFFSPEWRELYKHTLREANRLGLEISLNIQSGWNLGGPTVKGGRNSRCRCLSQSTRTDITATFSSSRIKPSRARPRTSQFAISRRRP
jgi:hypothetical protein